ncbi:uncharacterized protein LOC143448890 isoform X1 [Clavelina lepadiformis]|uniref:uncharacterized protein LOC143448890 isoform X1 n=2 Tax=Clavelina lepadiformis TaxID=159417 RepID=UPI00404137DE
MVGFVKYYEMEDDGRRSKKVGLFRRMFGGGSLSVTSDTYRQSMMSLGPTVPPRERRPLRSVPTIGSHYKVDPEVLAKEYVEKETKYMGTITDIRIDFDPCNRASLLSLIDEKRRIGQLPWQMTWKHDAIISIFKHNIKILHRDEEQLIHRIPTHHVASAGYVKDDNQTYLFLKFASEVNEEMSNLALFSCETKEIAEEICCLIRQLFQLVYTDSTMDFFDKSIQDGATTPKNHSYSTDDSDKKDTVRLTLPLQPQSQKTLLQQEPQTLKLSNKTSGSELPPDFASNEISKSATLPMSAIPSSIHPQSVPLHRSSSSNGAVLTPLSSSSTPPSPVAYRKSGNNSGSNVNTTHHQLQLNEYIAVLKERLTQEELTQFAQYLHHFRTGRVTIELFCEQLLAIYTEQRKSLLLGMRHFIPATTDREYFESFLQLHNVETSHDDDKWWDQPPETGFSEAEDSSVSTSQINELSSNSDPVSRSPTSEENSVEWRFSISTLDEAHLNEDNLPSTLKRHSAQEVSKEADLTPQASIDGSEISFERRPSSKTLKVSDVVLGLEEGDSPLLRSGATNQSVEHQLILPHSPRDLIKQQSKKKSRGKSPSAVELGAPFPSLATGGTDDDIDPVQETSFKSRSLKKYKSKLARDSSEDKNTKVKKDSELKVQSSDETPPEPPSSSEILPTESLNAEKQLPESSDKYTAQAAQSDRKKKSEHRKKKKHKSSSSSDKVVTSL